MVIKSYYNHTEAFQIHRTTPAKIQGAICEKKTHSNLHISSMEKVRTWAQIELLIHVNYKLSEKNFSMQKANVVAKLYYNICLMLLVCT